MFILEVWNKNPDQKSLSFYSGDDSKSELGFGAGYWLNVKMKKGVVVDKESSSIKYYEEETLLFGFEFSDILAIGEVTTNQVPFTDDHFLLFITKNKSWNPIPTDANGFDILTDYVGSKLNIVSFIQLANRTDFKSRIVYPKNLEGKEFIKLEPIPSENLIDKVSFWLGLKDKYRIVAISEVHDKLNNK
ncbi:hypothetical protein [uncultured Imperialibacter sp.]|uniref:hypothetical protein n=1 Tax=uncultured Imperialibacter sp. TaxID=1672639 RepID=UPI0030D798D4|tara:strand:+ start:9651 stop:10217 length:567 start_codon:yes stop_codon:yes gene_type:complete